MRKSFFKTTICAIFIVIFIFSSDVYANTEEATNIYDLEKLILNQLNLTSNNFEIIYKGSIEDINNTLNNILKKDSYLRSTITSVKWTTNSTTKGIYKINIESNHISSLLERKEADKKIDTIISNIIKPYMNDHEKVKAVHDYIVLNGEYDRSNSYYSDYDLLTHGKSVCNGYALLTYKMLNKLNIPVRFVFGTSNSIPHVWNMVKLDNLWFHLDTTWDDPLPNKKDSVSYNYYLLTDLEILSDHIIEESLYLPIANIDYYDHLNQLIKSSFNSHIYKCILKDTGLDMYNEENTASTTNDLNKILNNKIKYHPTKISIRYNKSISEKNVNTEMSRLFKNKYISEINYDPIVKDKTGKNNILNLYIKYKRTPDKIETTLINKPYNILTSLDLNVYAIYGSIREDITKDVLIYPYDSNFINISNSKLSFKDAGSHNLTFEYQGKKITTNVTALDAKGFDYITDKKPTNPINVKVFDRYIDFSNINQWPYIESGRTLVPLRAIFEVLNCNVSWDANTNSAKVEHGDTEIIIPANNSTVYVNNATKQLDVPAKLINGRIMVPLRFIGETINKIVVWDDINRTVLIY